MLAVAAAGIQPLGAGEQSRSALTPVVEGAIVDSTTGLPVVRASVRIESGVPVLSGPTGRFMLTLPEPGSYRLAVRHVAYESREVDLDATSDLDTLAIRVVLVPHAFQLPEIAVRADVTPLTSDRQSSHLLPRALLDALPVDRTLEMVALIPGVVVSGDRPFFRGLGFEHVLPLIDGVPAREPITGEWIVPPPDAIGSAEYVAGAFDAEHGQALSGIFEFSLAEGGSSHRGRAGYAGDRTDVVTTSGTRTDLVTFSASGPAPVAPVFYALSWQGRLSDTYLSYDHALPRQSLLGIALADRMEAEEAASLKLTLRPREARWSAVVSAVHVAEERKPYLDHYARAGSVGYDPALDRYLTFVALDPTPVDSTVFFDGPGAVPLRTRRSTLASCSWRWRPAPSFDLQLLARGAWHARSAGANAAGKTEDDIRNWIGGDDVTRPTHQTERYYAVHGAYPLVETGASREGGFQARLRARVGPHDLACGAGVTAGRHRYFRATQGALQVVGRLDDWIETLDGHGYLQDTWHTDQLSSLQIGLRFDHRAIRGFHDTEHASTLSPRIGLHQPMTDVDALHVQAGLLHEFQPLQSQFMSETPAQGGTEIAPQRTNVFEVGVQHHASRALVVYVGTYIRRSAEVVLVEREPTELSALLGEHPSSSEAPVVRSEIRNAGVELTLDHRFHRAVYGQANLSIGRTTIDDSQAPWSRTFFLSGWLVAHPTTALRLSASSYWSAGRPYSICLSERGCLEADRYEGALPNPFEVDLAASWRVRAPGGNIRVSLEVRNLLDRRVPALELDLYPMSLTAGNFLAYYDATGETGGYLTESDGSAQPVDLGIQATRTAGRNLRLGLEYAF